jgi:hypothetical protein
LAQDKNAKNKIALQCTLPKKVYDNIGLNAKIIIKNISDSAVTVYKEIVEGMFSNGLINNFTNFSLIVQKKRENIYHDYFNKSFIEPAPGNDTIDNLEKSLVEPHDSLIIYFHVDSRYQFEIGDYRIKCLYWNNIHINQKIESSWVYFKVIRKIYVKHYYDEILN